MTPSSSRGQQLLKACSVVSDLAHLFFDELWIPLTLKHKSRPSGRSEGDLNSAPWIFDLHESSPYSR